MAKKEVKKVEKRSWLTDLVLIILLVIPVYVFVIGVKSQLNVCVGGWCPEAMVYYFIAIFLYIVARYFDKMYS